jgi:integral membrane protein
MSPLGLFRRVAVAEAITWALLLAGMFLKYVTDTTELGVRVAGPIHGVVFVAFCVTTVVVAVDQRWKAGRLLLGLVSSIPPFATIAFDRYAESRGALARTWRLVDTEPVSLPDRVVGPLLRRPYAGLLVALVVVAVLTALALLVGPPGT